MYNLVFLDSDPDYGEPTGPAPEFSEALFAICKRKRAEKKVLFCPFDYCLKQF